PQPTISPIRGATARRPEPSLRPHPLTGKLQGMQDVSLTYSYRITLTVQVTENEILLLDIGSHDRQP
ncbi:MAG: type II toxin-antitoxin system RelE/ParE family toxin, partial [Thiobacillus sp.]